MMLRERSVREHALWTVGILVFLGCGAFAQGIVLEPTPESVSVEPPSLVTLGFRITNETAVDEGLRAEVTVPTDWRVVASLPSVDLPAGGTDVLLALIRVPQGTPAGEYPVEFRVRRTSDGVVLAEASVSVHVTDAFGLTVQAIDDTANVLAGQLATYEVTVTNVGNATCWFSVDVAAEWPADAAPSSGTLPPNGAAAVAVFHEVPVGIDAGSTDWLHITVRGSDGAEDSVTLRRGWRLLRASPLPRAYSRTFRPRSSTRWNTMCSTEPCGRAFHYPRLRGSVTAGFWLRERSAP